MSLNKILRSTLLVFAMFSFGSNGSANGPGTDDWCRAFYCGYSGFTFQRDPQTGVWFLYNPHLGVQKVDNYDMGYALCAGMGTPECIPTAF